MNFIESRFHYTSMHETSFSEIFGVLDISMASEYTIGTPTLVGITGCIHSLLWDYVAQVVMEYSSLNDIKIWITIHIINTLEWQEPSHKYITAHNTDGKPFTLATLHVHFPSNNSTWIFSCVLKNGIVRVKLIFQELERVRKLWFFTL